MKKKTVIIISVISVLVVLSVLCGLYLHYENTKLSISNYNITNDKIPSAFNDYKIVQISDLHNTRSKTLTDALIKEIKRQEPDMIVITGDLIDCQKYDLQSALDLIEEIKNVAPIYYVPGNHEAGSGKYEDITSCLAEKGVHVLDDTYDTITINNDSFDILGVSDPAFYPSYLSDQMGAALEDILEGIEDGNFKLLLSHRPELFDVYTEYDIDLVLSGHAHGGQIRLPFIGGLVAPNQGLFPKYTSGEFKQNDTTMIVSRGIGNSVLPFRIKNYPSVNFKNRLHLSYISVII